MRIRLAIPDHLVTAEALEAALEATSLANAEAIRQGEVPTISEAISRGVKWREEPFHDGEHFDLAHKVAERGWGDCDDLAPWLTGELRATGQDEGAVSRVYKTGPSRWHVVTQTSDGEILDPSRWAGMGKRSGRTSMGVSGMVARPFAHEGRGALCVVPHGGIWRARCDMPWGDGYGAHLASHAAAKTPDRALERAISGAIVCGEQIESPLVEEARDVASLLLTDARELLGDSGIVGSTFGRIFRRKASAAVSGTSPMFDRLMSPYLKAWETEMRAKGYTNASPPPMTGDSPDSFHSWGLAHGLHKSQGKLGQFFSAIKQAGGMAAPAANVLAPGAGMALSTALRAGAPLSALTSLAHGGGMPRVPGGIVDPRGSGAVSVPLPLDDAPQSAQHMAIFYHPLGAPGPVVMRF